MSSPPGNDSHPTTRSELTKLLRPTTLPTIVLDAGAAGERIEPPKTVVRKTPTTSATELTPSFAQSSSQTQIFPPENDRGYTPIFLIALRIAFYLAVISLAFILSLAACKFTNFWDPCEHLYINTTECKVTSYLKGMVYHTDCTEEHYCILPGFQSNFKRQEWSLQKPNETAAMTKNDPQDTIMNHLIV